MVNTSSEIRLNAGDVTSARNTKINRLTQVRKRKLNEWLANRCNWHSVSFGKRRTVL